MLLISIRWESSLTHAPVIKLPVIGMELGASGEGLPVDTVIKVFAVPGTVPGIDEALIEISPTGRYHRSANRK
jgi:hypothetical protein